MTRKFGEPRDRRVFLDCVQVATARRMWLANEPAHAIAAEIGVSLWILNKRLEDQLDDLPRRGRGRGLKRKAADPTPEEIAERAAIERERWSDEERDRRWRGFQGSDN